MANYMPVNARSESLLRRHGFAREGYAKEASLGLLERILHYPLDTVTAHIHPDHIASQQVATGLGLERSGQCQDGEEVWSAGVDPADKSGVHRSALEFNSRPS